MTYTKINNLTKKLNPCERVGHIKTAECKVIVLESNCSLFCCFFMAYILAFFRVI